MTEYPSASDPDGGWSGGWSGDQPPGYPPPTYQPAGHQPPYQQYGPPRYDQPPPPGWYPYPPAYGTAQGPVQRRLDGWSVAGLICGILPTVVLGLACSVVGLVRTGSAQRRGRAFAVAGLVASLAWLAGFGALGAYANAHQEPPDTAAGNVNPLELAVGDCFQQPPLTGQSSLPMVLKVSCNRSHNAVIVATVKPPNTDYPGLSTVLDQAVALCHTQVLNYLDRPLGRLSYAAYAPGQLRWESGYKTASCVLYDPDRNFTGDIRKDR